MLQRQTREKSEKTIRIRSLRESFPAVDWEEAKAEAALGALRLIQKKREAEA